MDTCIRTKLNAQVRSHFVQIEGIARNMQAVKTRSTKMLKIGISLYLIILYAVIVPTHHHEDGHEHTDCTICIIAHQPSLAAMPIAFIVISILFIEKFVLHATVVIRQFTVQFRSRAPPLM